VITGAILTLLSTILVAVLSLLPSIPVPDWLSSSTSAVATVFQDAGLMSVWFPITLVATILTAVAGIYAAGFGLKLARIVISLFTGGGGGAA
jgi:hypothetical protein